LLASHGGAAPKHGGELVQHLMLMIPPVRTTSRAASAFASALWAWLRTLV
jgi:hypothetical protein